MSPTDLHRNNKPHPFLFKLLTWDKGAIVNASIAPNGDFPSRPHHTVCLNGTKRTALLDTGSDVSMVKEALLPSLTYQPLSQSKRPPLPFLFDVQGNPIDYTGYYEFHFTDSNGLDIVFPLYVVPSCDSDILLGNDFMRLTRAHIDVSRQRVTFENPLGTMGSISAAIGASSEGTKGFRVSPVEETIVEANDTSWVTLQIEAGNSVQLRPGASVILLNNPSGPLAAIDSIITLEADNRVTVPFSNNSLASVSMPKGVHLPATTVFLSDNLRLVPAAQVASATTAATRSSPLQPLSEKKKLYLLANLDLEGIPKDFHQSYIDFVLTNHDIFSESQYDLGISNTIKTCIRMKTSEPIYSPQFKIPDAHRDLIDEWVQSLLKSNAIRRCRSPYNSPIFCVEKNDGSGAMRVVQDLRGINRNSYDEKFCTLDVRGSIAELGNSSSNVFSTLDLTGAFWQVALDPASSPMTAFTISHKGAQYEWLRTPMGAKQSSASMSRLMAIVFEGLEGVLSYVDDVLIHSKGHPAHLRTLNAVAPRLRQHGLKLNLRKTSLGKEEQQWLGVQISRDGISPSKDKVRAVTEMKEPDSRASVESFLGFANFFRGFLPNLASLSFPLCKLIRQGSSWKGGPLPPDAKKAFRSIVKQLAAAPLLAHPDPAKPYRLYTDACCGDSTRFPGLGAVLCQLDSQGAERPIGYFSRQFRHHELNYSAHAAECRAILDAMDFFHEYVHGKKTTVFCDHRPAEGTSRSQTKTLHRLHELLNEYNLDIVWKPGSENKAADALSRNAVAASVSHLGTEVRRQQANDPLCAALISFISDPKSLPQDPQLVKLVTALGPLCVFREGALWFTKCRPRTTSKMCMFAPESLVPAIIRANHGPAISGHWGLQRTLERIMVDFFWPTMARDTANYISACPECQQILDRPGTKERAPLNSWPPPTGQHQRIHCDLVGPMKTSDSFKYVLVITDAYDRFVELSVLPNKTAETVGRAIFTSWFCRWGCPSLIVVDGGKEFANSVLAAFLRAMQTDRHVISPLHPQANGQVERFNRSLKAYLTALDSTTLEWEAYIPTLQWAHNSSYNRNTHMSPFYLRTLQDPKFPWSSIKPFSTSTVVESMLRNLIESRDMVRENNEKARAAYTAYYDRKSKDKAFKPGDKVLVHYPDAPPKVNRKLYRPWRTGFQVVRMHPDNPTIVKVRTVANDKVQDLHLNRVRLFHEFEDSSLYDLPTQIDSPPDSAHSAPIVDRVGQMLEDASLQHGPVPARALTFQTDRDASAHGLSNSRLSNPSSSAQDTTRDSIEVSFNSASSGIQHQQASTPILDNRAPSRNESAVSHNSSGGRPSAPWTSASTPPFPPLEELAQQLLPRRITRYMGIPPHTWDAETHERRPPGPR